MRLTHRRVAHTCVHLIGVYLIHGRASVVCLDFKATPQIQKQSKFNEKKKQNESHSELNNAKSNPSENSLELVGKS